MTPFQKLFWFLQMGLTTFCDENPRLYRQETVISNGKNTLSDLDKELLSIKNTLAKTATYPMGGVGGCPAKVMCILESPSAQEDRTGTYLSGPEGELTQKMLSAIGLDIQSNTYVAYLSPWRPPGQRLLTPVEAQKCQQLLNKRIQCVRPQYLLLLGIPVAHTLLKGVPLSQIRQGQSHYQNIPTFGTFGPSYILKNTTYRRQVWEDLKKFKSLLDCA